MPQRLALARTTARKQDSSKIRNNTIIMLSNEAFGVPSASRKERGRPFDHFSLGTTAIIVTRSLTMRSVQSTNPRLLFHHCIVFRVVACLSNECPPQWRDDVSQLVSLVSGTKRSDGSRDGNK